MYLLKFVILFYLFQRVDFHIVSKNDYVLKGNVVSHTGSYVKYDLPKGHLSDFKTLCDARFKVLKPGQVVKDCYILSNDNPRKGKNSC